MTLALSTSKCFDAVSSALKAVNEGKASEAAIILRFVKNDALSMECELRKYYRKLQRVERQYENKTEHLTRKINCLYQEEQKRGRKERELEELVEQLRSQNQRNVESRNEAERRYRQASDEERRAREKREFHEVLFWIPILNIFAAIAEAVEENGEKARQARAEMERYQRRINDENDDIRSTNARISYIRSKITEVQREAQSLRKQRDSCHDELGAVKSIVVFILDASIVSREILNLTEGATVKTENLERLMLLAAKKNTLKILRSGGIQTKVGSFKECWDEMEDMVHSSLLSLDEQLYCLY